MSEILDNIVNCNISIEAPVEDGASFGTILLIGREPSDKGEHFKQVDKYASLLEVMEAGWKENEEIYKAARAAFNQDQKPKFVYIAVRKTVTREPVGGGEGSETSAQEPGENIEETETVEPNTEDVLEVVTETIKRALDTPGWYGLALAGAEERDYEEAAKIIESTEKIFAFTTTGMKNPVTQEKYMRTFGIYSEDAYAHVAWLSKGFSYDPGSETWAYKTLAGILPSEITSREMRLLEEDNLNYYVSCAGRDITRNGKMVGGEWIDIIRFRDWLKNQMQIKIYELFVKHPKIPYTDAGIVLVENQMEAVLAEGQRAGGIADTEYDENDEPVYGYIVTVPKAASLSSDQRASRVLTGCQFRARLSGAIHVAELKGNLVY